jgi:hypothetical protein
MVLGDKSASVLAVMPFAPDEGMLIWFYEKMNECGIKQNDICLLYILEEPPKLKGNRPSVAQLRTALPRVTKELTDVDPKLVVPCGREALYLTTGLNESIEDARGYLIKPDLRGTFVQETIEQVGVYKQKTKTGKQKGDPKMGIVRRAIPGLLPSEFKGWVIPSYTLHHIQKSGFGNASAFKADMRRVRRALDGKLKIIDEGFQYYTSLDLRVDGRTGSIYRDPRGEDDYSGEALAIDIETTGVGNRTIECFSISDGTRTHTLKWTKEHADWLQRQINLATGWLIFHNRPFDVPRLRDAGLVIPEGKIYDSMYGAVVVQPDLRKGLGCVVPVYCDTYPWKWERLSKADPNLYSALDGFKTARLCLDGLWPTTKQMRMWPLVTGEDFRWGPGIMATIPELSNMTEGGLRINRPFAEEWSNRLSDELLTLHREWAAVYPDVDPASNKQMAQLFYTQWHLPVVRTKKGEITTDELAVVKSQAYIQSDYAQRRDESPWRDDPHCKPEIFDLLLKIRETSKNLNTYCSPALLEEDTYVHPSYLPASKRQSKDADDDQHKGGTSTGRLASSGPNIQNQPKYARNLYVPDHDDWCFIQYDYTRAEMFAMAASANDDVMLEDLREDPYQRIADQVNISRKIAKNVTLAGQYLASAGKVSDMIMKDEHIYVDPLTCKRVLDALRDRWRMRTAYVRWISNTVRQKGYLVNPFGRVRVFPDRRATEAVNFIPQSIVADILWCVLRGVATTARALGGRMTTTVHDSILIQVPQDHVDEAKQQVKSIMERRFDCVAKGFYLGVGIETGEPGASWGSVK